MREELLFHWQKVVDVEQVGPEILNVGRYRARRFYLVQGRGCFQVQRW